ncbi:MAG: type II and III secretion system protein [Planctomycetes bacterium]|nr:type II and III secretion system protein [Planctomycetota bacterium]
MSSVNKSLNLLIAILLPLVIVLNVGLFSRKKAVAEEAPAGTPFEWDEASEFLKIGGLVHYLYRPECRNGKNIADELNRYKSPEGSITWLDPSNNYTGYRYILIKEKEEHLPFLLQMLREFIDVPPPQVMIEAKVAEVQYNRSFEFGYEGTFDRSLAGDTWFRHFQLTFNPESFVLFESNASTLPFQGTTLDFMTQDDTRTEEGWLYRRPGQTGNPANLRFTESVGEFQVLNRPTILVTEGQQAVIEVGDQVPFQQFSSSNTRVTEVRIIDRDATTRLNVQCDVVGPTSVRMHIILSVGGISGFTDPSEGAVAQPIIETRSLDSWVTLRDQQTFIVGGIFREENIVRTTGVPYLSDIPLVGVLFKSNNRERHKKELLFFLTPTIISQRQETIEIGG